MNFIPYFVLPNFFKTITECCLRKSPISLVDHQVFYLPSHRPVISFVRTWPKISYKCIHLSHKRPNFAHWVCVTGYRVRDLWNAHGDHYTTPWYPNLPMSYTRLYNLIDNKNTKPNPNPNFFCSGYPRNQKNEAYFVFCNSQRSQMLVILTLTWSEHK